MRDKRLWIYLLFISIFLLSMLTLMAYADTNETARAKSFALYSPDSKQFICGKNLDAKLPMASTTKIVTALLAIENLDLSKKIEVNSEAIGVEGSSIYLKDGDVLTAEDLIYAVMLQSANDAAAALAIEIAGSTEEFASMMTKWAKSIGADNTSFKNPHGLDNDDHYTTAHDLAIMTAEALKNEVFKKIAGTYKYTFILNDTKRTLINHNKLLSRYDGCIGVKTGYTKKSGRCLVSAAERDGITLISVTLSDPDDWNDHKNLLDYGFSVLESIDITSICKIPNTVPVINGNKECIKIDVSEIDRRIVKNKKQELLMLDIKIPAYLTKNVKKGDKVGQITISVDGVKKEIDVLALEDCKIMKSKKLF